MQTKDEFMFEPTCKFRPANCYRHSRGKRKEGGQLLSQRGYIGDNR